MSKIGVNISKSFLRGVWTVLQPYVLQAATELAREFLVAVKNKSLPADSQYKWLESLGDKVIDDVLSHLPADPTTPTVEPTVPPVTA